ncbi:MAG: hypothetical protein KGD58_08505 [Candidatus Lokiarchaeota archaeon]|nr:hypothetical protein [Candidatus Lokiarchaeota archaeon]
MEFHEKLRITAGILCFIVAILRIVLFFIELGSATIYSFLFINPNETVNIFEGLLIVIFAVILTILVTIFAVVSYVVLGILQITLRTSKTPSIFCNILTGIGILLSIRVFVLLASLNEFSILLTILAIFYITIFSLCIVSYVKLRKEG